MTEAEWLAATLPLMVVLPRGVRARASDRRVRLLACACCHHVWKYLVDERSREAVRVAEKFIDAGVREYVLHGAFFAAADATSRTPGVHDGYAYFAQMAADASLTLGQLVACFEHIPSSPQGHYEDELGIEGRFKRQSTQVGFIRDIFGNPFRPVPFLPEWRTATTVGIATAIYEERAFDRLPILADAMQDAGCEDADVLAHCRDGGPHVRGCWVVDGVLGKG